MRTHNNRLTQGQNSKKYSSIDQTEGYRIQGIAVQKKTQQRQQEQQYKYRQGNQWNANSKDN
jgi:hypothetical protein